MNRVCSMSIAAGLVLAAGSASAQVATHAWGSSWDFKNPNDKIAALTRAQLVNQAENGGLTVVTNIAGDMISNTTYEGPVTQASSTNAGNMSTTTNTINAQDSNVTLTVRTGQTTSNVSQGSNSDAASRGPGN